MDDLNDGLGWAGPAVVLLNLTLDSNASRVVAHVSIDETGNVTIDDHTLCERWTTDGIVGRAEMGRVYPADGQAFLDELPFVYRGAYLRAVPEDDLFGGVS